MPRQRWDDETRQEALDLYLEHGPAIAARMTGVKSATIRSWAHKAGLTNRDDVVWSAQQLAHQGKMAADELERHNAEFARWLSDKQIARERKRAELLDRWLDEAHDLLDRLHMPHEDFKGKDARRVVYDLPTASASFSYVKAAATALDKYRLEVGESTDRTEVIGGDSGIDREIQRLMAEMERRAQAEAAGGNVEESAPSGADTA